MILAIDTSTDQASVALAEGGRPLCEWSWIARGNHSRHLTWVIRELLRIAGCSPASLTGIAVARGPGSFNGLRVGVSEAKGLAVALQIPLVGIATLDVIAFQASEASPDVWAVVPAGRGQVSLAEYRGRGESWRRSGDYLTVTVDEASRLAEGAGLLAGCGAEAVAETMQARGLRPTVAPPVWQMRRAAFLAELGRRYLEAGGVDQLANLEPLYLRRSAAEERRESNLQE